MPGFGRIYAPDPRDHQFMLAPLTSQATRRASKLWAYFDKPMNQGNTGTCVGHGWKGWLATAPIIQSGVSEAPHPFDIYDAAIMLDEWPTNDVDPDREFGTSVRAGAKALRDMGYLAEFRWAFSVDDAANWLGGIDAAGRYVGGPLVIGVNWYDSMFDTDAEGFLRIGPDSQVAGGHCVCLTGWNERLGFAYGLNSWGGSWGHKGRFYMPGEVLQRLLAEDGEACSTAEVRRVA
jgi:hypothetical protein